MMATAEATRKSKSKIEEKIEEKRRIQCQSSMSLIRDLDAIFLSFFLSLFSLSLSMADIVELELDVTQRDSILALALGLSSD